MSRRLLPHRFRQAVKAGLPVQRHVADAEITNIPEGMWKFLCNILRHSHVSETLSFSTYDSLMNLESKIMLDNSDIQSANGDLYEWTARERDADTELQYHRARHFDPNPIRWLCEDPLAFGAADDNLVLFVLSPQTDETESSASDHAM
jgi:RHS repeat-associated protein